MPHSFCSPGSLLWVLPKLRRWPSASFCLYSKPLLRVQIRSQPLLPLRCWCLSAIHISHLFSLAATAVTCGTHYFPNFHPNLNSLFSQNILIIYFPKPIPFYTLALLPTGAGRRTTYPDVIFNSFSSFTLKIIIPSNLSDRS